MLTKGGMHVFEIVRVKEEAPECFSYILQSRNNAPLTFIPGQFLTVLIEMNGRQLRRAYSISAVLPGGRIQLTVKRVENGAVSRHILAHWHTGTWVDTLGPAGRFVLPEIIRPGSRFVFIAAGSGITPVFALLQSLLNNHAQCSVLLLGQFRSEKQIIFRDSLKDWQQAYPDRFEPVLFLSRPENHQIPVQRLNNELLERLMLLQPANVLHSAFYYICGPLPFMRMAAYTLREVGVPEAQIRRELFDPPREPAAWFQLDPAPHLVTIRRNEEEISFPAAFPDTIMEAAAKAGISIPFSCKAGICSTCTMRCVSGSVTMRLNEVLTESDLHSGLVLTCVGYATSNIVLTSKAG